MFLLTRAPHNAPHTGLRLEGLGAELRGEMLDRESAAAAEAQASVALQRLETQIANSEEKAKAELAMALDQSTDALCAQLNKRIDERADQLQGKLTAVEQAATEHATKLGRRAEENLVAAQDKLESTLQRNVTACEEKLYTALTERATELVAGFGATVSKLEDEVASVQEDVSGRASVLESKVVAISAAVESLKQQPPQPQQPDNSGTSEEATGVIAESSSSTEGTRLGLVLTRLDGVEARLNEKVHGLEDIHVANVEQLQRISAKLETVEQDCETALETAAAAAADSGSPRSAGGDVSMLDLRLEHVEGLVALLDNERQKGNFQAIESLEVNFGLAEDRMEEQYEELKEKLFAVEQATGGALHNFLDLSDEIQGLKASSADASASAAAEKKTGVGKRMGGKIRRGSLAAMAVAGRRRSIEEGLPPSSQRSHLEQEGEAEDMEMKLAEVLALGVDRSKAQAALAAAAGDTRAAITMILNTEGLGGTRKATAAAAALGSRSSGQRSSSREPSFSEGNAGGNPEDPRASPRAAQRRGSVALAMQHLGGLDANAIEIAGPTVSTPQAGMAGAGAALEESAGRRVEVVVSSTEGAELAALVSDGATVIGFGDNMGALEASLSAQLFVTGGTVQIQIFDGDFGEWCRPSSVDEVVAAESVKLQQA